MIYYFTSKNQMYNIGDIAIDYATIKLLNDNNIKFEIVNDFNFDKFKYTGDDIALIKGGGWIGLYDDLFMKKALNLTCKKILMPSSLNFFNNNINNIKTYMNNHIIIFARDANSYKKFKKYFINSVVFKCKDIVLYLSKQFKDYSSSGNNKSVVISRSDREMLNDIKKHNLSNDIMKNTIDNMFIGYTEQEYKNEIFKYLDKLNLYDTIYTDTLHISLFSILLKKNLFVFDNGNHKVFDTLDTYNVKSNTILKDSIICRHIINTDIKYNYDIIVNILKNEF